LNWLGNGSLQHARPFLDKSRQRHEATIFLNPRPSTFLIRPFPHPALTPASLPYPSPYPPSLPSQHLPIASWITRSIAGGCCNLKDFAFWNRHILLNLLPWSAWHETCPVSSWRGDRTLSVSAAADLQKTQELKVHGSVLIQYTFCPRRRLATRFLSCSRAIFFESPTLPFPFSAGQSRMRR
jgi:hypothetical protein